MKTSRRLFLIVGTTLFHPYLATAATLIHEYAPEVPIIFFSIATQGGAAHDPGGRQGLTQLMTQLLLRGTQSTPKDSFARALDVLGANLEIETRLDTVIIHGAVLHSEWGPFTQKVVEMLAHPAFSALELERLRAETLSQLGDMVSDDGVLAKQHFLKFLLYPHPYARPVFGTQKGVRAIEQPDVTKQFRKLFRPDDLIVAVNGALPLSAAQTFKTQIEKALERNRSEVPLPLVENPPPNAKKKLLIVDKPGRTQTRVFVGQLGLALKDPGYTAFSIENQALGGSSFSARLIREIRVNRGWSYFAGSRQLISRNRNAWYVAFAPALKDTVEAVAFTDRLLQDLSGSGMQADEFEFAKANLIKNSAFLADSPAKRTENALTEALIGLEKGFFAKSRERIALAQEKESSAIFSSFLKASPRVWVVLGPAKEIRADLERALNIPKDESEVIPYQDDL